MTDEVLEELIQTARQLGATEAAVISPDHIAIEKDLADLCGGDPRCPFYGFSVSCPPHVSGPEGFKEWQAQSRHAIVYKIDIPSSVLFSAERREVGMLLHNIAAGIELKAKKMGYRGSRGFAGGSCKITFCNDFAECAMLSDPGECRNPESARPSMSGFGVNVAKLMQTAGWPAKIAAPDEASDESSMSWIAGLVLIIE